MAEIILTGPKNKKNVDPVTVTIEHIPQAAFDELCADVCEQVSGRGNVEGVAAAFLTAVNRFPRANPSDIWLYVLKYTYVDKCDSEQSWKRSSGAALERVWERHYNQHLAAHGLRWVRLDVDRATRFIESCGLTTSDIPPKKLDAALISTQDDIIVAIMHSKASLAERITDDAPASRRLIEKGCACAIVTMDMKHFPPPHGDGVNYGELGGRRHRDWLSAKESSQKRGYVEGEGAFSALFSFNQRTPPSGGKTRSGYRISTLSFADAQPDALVTWAKGLPR